MITIATENVMARRMRFLVFLQNNHYRKFHTIYKNVAQKFTITPKNENRKGKYTGG